MDLIIYGGELYHHGIRGQKWGIRRYQNEDGTLTPEGKAKLDKYKSNQTNIVSKNAKSVARRYDKQFNRVSSKLSKELLKDGTSKKAHNLAKKATYIAETQAENKRRTDYELNKIKNMTFAEMQEENKAASKANAFSVAASACSVAAMMLTPVPMAWITVVNTDAVRSNVRMRDYDNKAREERRAKTQYIQSGKNTAGNSRRKDKNSGKWDEHIRG